MLVRELRGAGAPRRIPPERKTKICSTKEGADSHVRPLLGFFTGYMNASVNSACFCTGRDKSVAVWIFTRPLFSSLRQSAVSTLRYSIRSGTKVRGS